VTFSITQDGDFIGGEEFEFSTTKDGWSVSGSESTGITNTARTDSPYQSDNNEVYFTINSGNTIFYKKGDQWTFNTNVICNWKVEGTKSGIQFGRAETGQPYSSDSNEVSFQINDYSTDPFAEDDEFEFRVTESGLGYGKTVRDIVKVPGTNEDKAVLYAAYKSIPFPQAVLVSSGLYSTQYINSFDCPAPEQPGTSSSQVGTKTNSTFTTSESGVTTV